MLIIWFVFCSVFFFVSSNLLLSLLLLEILTFLVLFFSSYFLGFYSLSEYYLLCFFCVFVMEGVIGLAGLVALVFYSGSDYISTSSLLKS